MLNENRRDKRALSVLERWMVGVYIVAAALFIGFHPKGTVAPLTDWRSLAVGVLGLAVSGIVSYAWDRKAGFAVVIGLANGYLAAGVTYQFL